MISTFEFQNPWLLSLLILIPVMIIWRLFMMNQNKPALNMPAIDGFGEKESILKKIKPILFALRLIALSLCIIALARPRRVDVSTKLKSDLGIDILLIVDTSASMLARDLKPDRLEALKEVAMNFAANRQTDRIGLVDYSGEALTKVPLTSDRKILLDEIRRLKTGELTAGTAIGVGLATGINHLKDSKAESKVIILITDGDESIDRGNNLMYVEPSIAADMAASMGIKVYTIGVGTNGYASFPVMRDAFTGNYIFEMQKVTINETLLEDIADKTGGLYFRATDNESLKEIYREIDKLEKTEINEIKYYNYAEMFSQLLFPALIILTIEFILRKTIFRELV